jgi:hypothetical protein
MGADPVRDERSYAALRDELTRRIPVHDPEWTDFNESDPAVTLVELFAFLVDSLRWLTGERQRQCRRRRARRLALLAVGAAGVGLAGWWTWKDRGARAK